MTSIKKLWTYKPLSDRRREDDDNRSEDRSGASSSVGSRTHLQRSSSLIYQPDLLSSQIKDFLQRTSRGSTERWRSKSRSIDINDEGFRRSSSRVLSPSSYCSRLSLSSRENSIWEEDNQSCSNEVFNGGNNMEEFESVTKHRYDSLKKQFHYTKQKLDQDHQAEMDKIHAVKKQLEQKLYDAYESLDEHKQIASQWKKKFGKLLSDYSEIRIQLDDQLSQKSLLEKRRRKEESDLHYLVQELNEEKVRTEKLFKEKELINQEKGKLAETVTDLNMELQRKTMQIKTLTEELNCNKHNVSENEVESIRKINNKLEKKCIELEEELEKSLRHIDSMENIKHKMEQDFYKMKNELKEEMSQREDDFEEAKYSMEKKMKTLQCQLEHEIHEKSLLMKERLKLERQIDDLQDNIMQSQSSAVSLLDKMKYKLIKTKALLKDERNKDQSTPKENSKLLLRKLKNQLDGVELEKLTAIKSKQKYEMEYADLLNNMTELEKNKHELENKMEDTLRELKNQQRITEDKDEEINEIMTKFASSTQQLADNQTVIQNLTDKLTNIEAENASLLVQIASLQTKLNNQESLATSSFKLQAENYKAKIKELESRNELDRATMARREQQLGHLSGQLEKALSENDKAQTILNSTARELKLYTRQIKDLQDEIKKLTQRESDLLLRNKDLALKVEAEESEKNMILVELKAANERLVKLKEEMEDTTSYFSDSSTESADDTTVSVATMDAFKFRSETPESIISGTSDTESRKNKG